MKRIKAKLLWRKLFGVYFKGDRVKVKILDDRPGKIDGKHFINGHWEYDVHFDHAMRISNFPPKKRLIYGIRGLSFEYLELLEE